MVVISSKLCREGEGRGDFTETLGLERCPENELVHPARVLGPVGEHGGVGGRVVLHFLYRRLVLEEEDLNSHHFCQHCVGPTIHLTFFSISTRGP